MQLWSVHANYDPEERVWYSVSGDVPGLHVDADTIERLAEKAAAQLPDLLELHADEFVDKGRLLGPHRLRIIAFHEREFDVAA